MSFINVTIKRNISEESDTGMELDNCNLFLDQVKIHNNQMEDGELLHIDQSEGTIINCEFIENLTLDDGPSVLWMSYSDITIRNTLIADNISTDKYGAIMVHNSNLNLINSTISNNQLLDDSDRGGIVGHTATINIENSIFWNNLPESINLDWGASTLSISHTNISPESIVEDNESIINWLDGNIDVDPLFVDSQNGNYALDNNSLCIDAGSSDPWSEDIDGSPLDLGFTGGSFIIPNFIDHNFQEVGNFTSSIDWTVYNYRQNPITIDNVNFNTDHFTTSTTLPLIIEPHRLGVIPIHCLPQEHDLINDVMSFESNQLSDNQVVNLTVQGVDQNILFGDISGLLNGVYRVGGDIIVNSTDTIYINPGTQFLFDGDYSMTVEGVMYAEGTVSDSIIFTNNEDINSQWDGIKLYNQNSESILDFIRISGAQEGISIQNTALDSSLVTINHSTISNCDTGIYVSGSTAISDDSIQRQGLMLNHLLISNTSSYGIQAEQYSDLSLYDVKIKDGWRGINYYDTNINAQYVSITNHQQMFIHAGLNTNSRFQNTLLNGTGYEDCEVSGAIRIREESDFLMINSTIANFGTTWSSTEACLGIDNDNHTNYPNFINTILHRLMIGSNINTYFCATIPFFLDNPYAVSEGNINIYPNDVWEDDYVAFTDPNGDFTLLPDSPCIDAGTSYLEIDGEVVLDLDESEYYGLSPDIGAFEYCPTQDCDDDLSNEEILPTSYNLSPAYPNPFNPVTNIEFSVPHYDKVSISIYDISGRLVTTLANGYFNPGHHSITWDANSHSSGVYFIKMQSTDFLKTHKVMLLK